MTTTKTLSTSSTFFVNNGDIHPGRGQLGRLATIVYDTDANTVDRKRLWNTEIGDARGAARYLIDADSQTGTKEVYLPPVGSATTEASVGHTVFIKNTGAVAFDVKNDSGTLVTTLNSNNYISLLATIGLSWTSVLEDPNSVGGGSLQDAYDASSTGNKIVVDTTLNGVSIRNDVADTAQSIFSVNSATTNRSLLNLHNNSTGADAFVITGLGNDDVVGAGILSTAIDSIALGRGTNVNINTIALGKSSTASIANSVSIGNEASSNENCVSIGYNAEACGTKKVNNISILVAESLGNYTNAGVGRYLSLYSPGHNYYVWINTNGTALDPLISDKKGIEVVIPFFSSVNTIAAAMATAINTTYDITASVSLGVITISRIAGGATSPDTIDTLVGLVSLTAGTAGTNVTGNISIGANSFARSLSDGIAIGSGAQSQNTSSIAIGSAAVSTGSLSIAVGTTATATASTSTSMGDNSSTVSSNGISIGSNTQSQNVGAIAVGSTAVSTGLRSISLGANTTSTGNYSIAIGGDSQSTSTETIAIGEAASATGGNSIAIGEEAQSSVTNSTAIGQFANTSAISGIALGSSSSSTGVNGSIAIGSVAISSQNFAIAIGPSSESSGEGSITVGYQSTSSTARSITIGEFSNTSGTDAKTFGRGITNAQSGTTVITDDNVAFTAQGTNKFIRRFANGEHLLSGSTFPAPGVNSSPSMRVIQASAESTGSTENLIMTITLTAETVAHIEYHAIGLVRTVGDSAPAYVAGQSWSAKLIIKARYDGTDTTVFGDGGAGNPVTPDQHAFADVLLNTSYTVRGTAGAGTVRLFVTNAHGGTTGGVLWSITANVYEISTTLAF